MPSSITSATAGGCCGLASPPSRPIPTEATRPADATGPSSRGMRRRSTSSRRCSTAISSPERCAACPRRTAACSYCASTMTWTWTRSAASWVAPGPRSPSSSIGRWPRCEAPSARSRPMRPDRPGDDRTGRGRQEASWAGLRPSDSSPSSLVPFEPLDTTGLSVLEEELAAAGRRIRAERSRAEWPDPLFAASLRDRLIGQLPFAERTTPAPRAERTVPAMDPPAFAPERLMPRLVRATPRFLPAPGWTIATIAAALVVSLVGLGPGHLLQAPAPSRAGDVAGASLVRGGSTTALAAGAALEVGDESRTTDIGRATLQLGNSQARLSGGSDMVIRSLAADGLVLEQLAGRAYHRVAVASGGTYTVMTAAVSWTAHGTAFDLDRRTLASGAERLTLLTIEHSVSVAGPDVSATVTEGRRAELVLGLQGVAPDIATGPIRPGELSDGWLAANAALDRTAGFSTGILTGLAPTVSPSSSRPTAPNVPSPPPGPAATAPADTSPKPAPKP